MAGASWPFTTHYPMVYPVGADGSNAASAANGFPITFTTLTLGAVTFPTLTLGTVSITGNPAVTFNTAVLGQVLPANSGVSSSAGSFTASAMSVVGSSTTRKFIIFQADSETQAWIAFGTAAVSGAPAVRIASNAVFRMDGNFIPRDSVTIYCQSFVSYCFIEG